LIVNGVVYFVFQSAGCTVPSKEDKVVASEQQHTPEVRDIVDVGLACVNEETGGERIGRSE
jgi:hypothetical protein